MKLVIVESPSKAKTIEKYLGAGYTVKASVGHIRDLPKSNKKAIDIAAGFVPHYEISPGKEAVVSELKKLAGKADEVLLATDPDREGEAIAWHLAELCGLKKPKRLAFHEITKNAIMEAITHPRLIDQDLRRAQEARRVLDRLVGYDLSGLIWKKVRYGLSAGRVQSPALRIIMEREREIRAFIPETFWRIEGMFDTPKKESILLTCTEEPRDKTRMESIKKAAEKDPWHVASVKETEASRSPKAPFTTSTIQQTASSRLGLSPSRTMRIAQGLYEKGLITYMRTDSTTLGKDAVAAITDTISKKFGKDLVMIREFKTKVKNAQEAHEAIRPTDPSRASAGVSPEEKRLYELIWQRTIASQMSDALLLRTTVAARVDDENIPAFTATGSRTLSPGWFLADPDARGEDVELPVLTMGDPLKLRSLDCIEKQTEPPARYSEAGLVKELEKRGIGRPSTYASIIKTIIDRGYVLKEGRTLHPTDTGDVVSTFLEEHFADYISDSFTADMEDELDDIAQGKRPYAKTLADFYTPFAKAVKSKEKIEKLTTLGKADKQFRCPICGGDMVFKLSRNGKFMSCEKFPDCAGARKEDGTELEGPKETGEACPQCKKGKLIERDGKFGRFVACDNYPKCKYIKKDATVALNGTGVPCPVCKKGEMAERRGRFGIFYSCSNYPDCKYAIKAKPTGKTCPTCGALMMEGTKTIPERCSDKTCPNHNPHKLEKSEK
ncbi:MAG: DNA topoisomerase I [Candidatus Yonathbacteria bacterium RIFCSPHIGHO2_01_FULL_51_10]|uniref:DNA topoisomerase 1 n=1 Tax=Candidatus Yonathbacteria bacterium RIFCSPHIGHO2_01_FULL_51_10 TaxID=1802723 RepID=A0A1G2S6N1_9BACT|nr:MAG: DNA topoisomerase I [Candidatus Yonathbacteria bacterium RIFCSPHIGHO2_01_FULL_51_10]